MWLYAGRPLRPERATAKEIEETSRRVRRYQKRLPFRRPLISCSHNRHQNRIPGPVSTLSLRPRNVRKAQILSNRTPSIAQLVVLHQEAAHRSWSSCPLGMCVHGLPLHDRFTYPAILTDQPYIRYCTTRQAGPCWFTKSACHIISIPCLWREVFLLVSICD